MSVSKSIVKKLALVASFGLAATLMSGEHAEAATSTASLDSSVTVNSFCLIYTGTGLAFPAYDPASGSASTATNTFTVDCTLNVPFAITLGASTMGTGGGLGNRGMAGQGAAAGSNLQYQVATSLGGADLAVGGSVAVGQSGNGYTGLGVGDQNYTVYGTIPAGQGVAGGGYLDAVVTTMTF